MARQISSRADGRGGPDGPAHVDRSLGSNSWHLNGGISKILSLPGRRPRVSRTFKRPPHRSPGRATGEWRLSQDCA